MFENVTKLIRHFLRTFIDGRFCCPRPFTAVPMRFAVIVHCLLRFLPSRRWHAQSSIETTFRIHTTRCYIVAFINANTILLGSCGRTVGEQILARQRDFIRTTSLRFRYGRTRGPSRYHSVVRTTRGLPVTRDTRHPAFMPHRARTNEPWVRSRCRVIISVLSLTSKQ